MLPEVVDEAARRFGDTAAFIAPDGTSTTYRELLRRSRHVAAGMTGAGVTAGDVVVLRLPSDSSYVLAYLGAASIGAITAGINPKLAPAEQQALVDLAGPSLTLHDSSQVAGLEATGARGPEVQRVASGLDTDVAIVFTSGTTGLPRAAVFTNRQIEAITRIDVGDRWGGGSHMIASTQFAHVGFMTKLAWYLRLGSTIHMIDKWTASTVLKLVSEYRMPSIGGVAPQIALMVRAPEARALDFSSVKTIVVGGGPSPPALVVAARETFGADYSIRYSSTESGGCGTGTAFDADDEEALYTVGRPRPGVDVSVRDGDEEVQAGEVGEVCLRSEAVMDRYWRDPETTAVTIRDGWLHSGDLGLLDERGMLHLAGRIKEMYIRGGYNVYPMEVEAALGDHPAVAEVAVVGVPDEVLGERGMAVVVPADASRPPTLDELCTHLEGRVATYKFPESLRVVDALPLTAMGKIDRRGLVAIAP